MKCHFFQSLRHENKRKQAIKTGLFDGILGNATDVNHEEVKQELANVLIEGEKIDLAFKLVRDLIVFTEYRLIIVDKQGLTGKNITQIQQALAIAILK